MLQLGRISSIQYCSHSLFPVQHRVWLLLWLALHFFINSISSISILNIEKRSVMRGRGNIDIAQGCGSEKLKLSTKDNETPKEFWLLRWGMIQSSGGESSLLVGMGRSNTSLINHQRTNTLPSHLVGEDVLKYLGVYHYICTTVCCPDSRATCPDLRHHWTCAEWSIEMNNYWYTIECENAKPCFHYFEGSLHNHHCARLDEIPIGPYWMYPCGFCIILMVYMG